MLIEVKLSTASRSASKLCVSHLHFGSEMTSAASNPSFSVESGHWRPVGKRTLANFGEGSKTDIGSHANEKTCFQSFFMLITVQPSFVASS
jgi:hypothetical protein